MTLHAAEVALGLIPTLLTPFLNHLRPTGDGYRRCYDIASII